MSKAEMTGDSQMRAGRSAPEHAPTAWTNFAEYRPLTLVTPRNPMKYPARLLQWTLAAALCFAHTSCTTIFHADFDADAAGALPNANPPGIPAGDIIYSTAGGSTTMLSVVDDAVIGSRSLRFRNDGGFAKYLGFIPVNVSPSANRIYAYWRGVVGSSNAPLDIWLGDTHFSGIGGIRFDGGNVRVRTGSDRFETIGTYQPNVLHAVIFTFHKSAGTFSVNFYQGGASLSRSGLPIENATAGNTVRPTLYMSYYSGGASTARYFCDDVVISQREPGSHFQESLRLEVPLVRR